MASLVMPHQLRLSPVAGLLLLLLLVVVIADSVRANKPIEIYPGCAKTVMPKRCSFKVSDLVKKLAETKATITGPQLAAGKLKTDSCITGCAKVVDELTPTAAAATTDAEALKQLKAAVSNLVIYNEGPIGPCQCNCPEPCTADESAAVKKLGAATEAMTDLAEQLRDLIDSGGDLGTEEKKAEAAAMEKSMDSGVVHVSCGLTKQPQRCADELAALVNTTSEAESAADGLKNSGEKLAPDVDSFIDECTLAVSDLNEQILYTEYQLKSLEDIRAKIRSSVQADCNPFVCPPPPKKPCSDNETAVVNKLNGVRTAWIAADKFLTELLPPAEAKGKEAPK